MIEITDETVAAGLDSIVEQYGEDFVYEKGNPDGGPSCAYVRNGQPDCIVGKFLHAQGVSLTRLERADLCGGTPAGTLLTSLEMEGVLFITGRAFEALAEAQYQQDNGAPWGDAASRAKRYLSI